MSHALRDSRGRVVGANDSMPLGVTRVTCDAPDYRVRIDGQLRDWRQMVGDGPRMQDVIKGYRRLR